MRKPNHMDHEFLSALGYLEKLNDEVNKGLMIEPEIHCWNGNTVVIPRRLAMFFLTYLTNLLEGNAMFEFPIITNAVQSGNIAESGYSPAQQVMEIKFKNGGRYRYRGVPQAIYDAYLEAPSKGSFVSSHLRGKFECVKYEEKSEVTAENKSCD